MKSYTMKIAGLCRSLPICRLSEEWALAGCVNFGDAGLPRKQGQCLMRVCNSAEYRIGVNNQKRHSGEH